MSSATEDNSLDGAGNTTADTSGAGTGDGKDTGTNDELNKLMTESGTFSFVKTATFFALLPACIFCLGLDCFAKPYLPSDSPFICAILQWAVSIPVGCWARRMERAGGIDFIALFCAAAAYCTGVSEKTFLRLLADHSLIIDVGAALILMMFLRAEDAGLYQDIRTFMGFKYNTLPEGQKSRIAEAVSKGSSIAYSWLRTQCINIWEQHHANKARPGPLPSWNDDGRRAAEAASKSDVESDPTEPAPVHLQDDTRRYLGRRAVPNSTAVDAS